MFGNRKKHNLGATDTLIGQGTSMEGKVKCEASLRIEGEFQGEIDSKGDIIIGEGGTARSNISAREVVIAGIVYGDITTKGRLTIMPSGQLHGNCAAQSLIIHDGGIFNGSSIMEKTEPHPLRTEAAERPSKRKEKEKEKQAAG